MRQMTTQHLNLKRTIKQKSRKWLEYHYNLLGLYNELYSQHSTPSKKNYLNLQNIHLSQSLSPLIMQQHTPMPFLYKKASDMVLRVHSAASYISEPKSRSRGGGHYFLSSILADSSKQTKNPMNNSPLHTKCGRLIHSVASATEYELGYLFHNVKITIPLSTTLEELGHQQPKTPI